MLILDANRHTRPVPALARWCLGAGIVATVGANLAHGLGHGPIGALVSAWPALALVGSFELLATLIRTAHHAAAESSPNAVRDQAVHDVEQGGPPALAEAPSLEQTVRAWHEAGTSQRAIARELNIDRRKVKRIIDKTAQVQPVQPRGPGHPEDVGAGYRDAELGQHAVDLVFAAGPQAHQLCR